MFFYSEATDGPIDPYFSNVSLLFKADGDNDSTTFVDSSANNFTISRVGNAKISTTESKYGGSSAYFDGTGDYITVANNAALNFGSGDFTIEMWLNPTTTISLQRHLFAKRSNINQWGLLAYINWNSTTMTRSVNIYIPNGSASNWAFAKTVTIPSTGWTHFALVRSGNEWSVYVNGVKDIISANSSFTLPSNTAPFIFGTEALSNSSRSYEGYMDDIRITKGVARYTENFTPPDSHPTTGP